MNLEPTLEKLQQLYKSCEYFRESINSSFSRACVNMNLELIDTLIKLGIDNNDRIQVFNNIVEKINIESSKQLLYLLDIQDETCLLKLFNLACIVGSVDVIEHLVKEKNINFHLKSHSAFTTACDKKQITLAKWFLANSACIYDENNIVPAFVFAASHNDSLMIQFLLDQEINITNSLDKALHQACRCGTKQNILKMIQLGANTSNITQMILNRPDYKTMYDVIENIISSENYIEVCDQMIKLEHRMNIKIVENVLQKYAKYEDIPIIFEWLNKSDFSNRFYFFKSNKDSECINMILTKNYKFFIDLFFDLDKYVCIDNLIGITDIQAKIFSSVVINYELFIDNPPDDFVLYLLYKRNDIESFCILEKMYPNIQFEIDIIDGKAKIVNYFYGKSVKSARNV